MSADRYNIREAEQRWQARWDEMSAYQADHEKAWPQILRARNVSVSQWPHPYGPCSKLHTG